MTRLEARWHDLRSRQHRRRMMAVELGEVEGGKEWSDHLVAFCRLGRKRRAVEDKMRLRGEDTD